MSKWADSSEPGNPQTEPEDGQTSLLEFGAKAADSWAEPVAGAPAAEGLSDSGYQSTLPDFGAVESSDLGVSGDSLAETDGALTDYLGQVAPTIEAINDSAGAVIGEALSDTVFAPLGPAGEVLGEATGEAVGDLLNAIWYELAEYVSDLVEPDSGYQSTLTDFGAGESDGAGDAGDQPTSDEAVAMEASGEWDDVGLEGGDWDSGTDSERWDSDWDSGGGFDAGGGGGEW